SGNCAPSPAQACSEQVLCTLSGPGMFRTGTEWILCALPSTGMFTVDTVCPPWHRLDIVRPSWHMNVHC
ncbi:hypothetical protein NDU88_000380, partial [Pleurodeles waltl]